MENDSTFARKEMSWASELGIKKKILAVVPIGNYSE